MLKHKLEDAQTAKELSSEGTSCFLSLITDTEVRMSCTKGYVGGDHSQELVSISSREKERERHHISSSQLAGGSQCLLTDRKKGLSRRLKLGVWRLKLRVEVELWSL
jgi:hypothetical protein